MKYWFLTIITAAISCFFGNIMPLTVGSMLFHEKLRRLGSGSQGISKFYRMYGNKGAAKMIGIELALDIVPVVIGGILFNTLEAAETGRMLAAFCVIFCRMFPLLGRFKGSTDGLFAMVVCLTVYNPMVGIATIVVIAAIFFWLRFRTIAVMAGAAAAAIFAVAIVDNTLCVRLCALCAVAVVIRNIPNVKRLFSGEEEHFEFRKDITYKFDEKF